jgi:NADP-dependent 3-hydroxy acid dehydrogenase YdfG
MDFQGKRYWLVGASEGLGRALAHRLHKAGAHVIVSARSRDRLDELVAELGSRAQAVTVDVADMEAVKKAVAEVGQIDGMVYLAGVYWPMKATEWDNDKAAMMGEINYLGASRTVGAVMPGFVAQGHGHIVLTGSLSGFRGLPGAIGYSASKAGIMALAESMECDLRGGPIRVQVGNPGFIKTRLTDKNDFKMPFLMTPEEAAEEMFTLMKSTAFKRSFPRVFSWLFRGSQFLPDWAYYRIFAG